MVVIVVARIDIVLIDTEVVSRPGAGEGLKIFKESTETVLDLGLLFDPTHFYGGRLLQFVEEEVVSVGDRLDFFHNQIHVESALLSFQLLIFLPELFGKNSLFLELHLELLDFSA